MGGWALQIESGKYLKIWQNNLDLFTRGACVENVIKIKALQKYSRIGETKTKCS